MELLPTAFTKRQFAYQQLYRQGDMAVYCQEHKITHAKSFEVIRIQHLEEHTWGNGDVTPAHEYYPSSGSWGREAWTFPSEPAALAFMEDLIHQLSLWPTKPREAILAAQVHYEQGQTRKDTP